MSRTTSATLLSLTFTVAAVIFALNSVSKPIATQAANAPVVAATEAAPIENFTYNGTHSDWVRKLLTRVGSWRCPANAADKGAPPSVKADECMRDKYVAAAVLYAWAAECYARQEEDSKATEAAEGMYEQLKEAKGFCSDAPSFNFGGPKRECDTIKIFGCNESL